MRDKHASHDSAPSHPWRTVDDARDRILATFAPLPAVLLPLEESLGLVLAEAVVAEEDLPPFANAAMDGYALRAADIARATTDRPARLRVTGEAPAGTTPFARVEAGTAVRIMTGAPLPAGADAVVRFEETDDGQSEPGAVLIQHSAGPGSNVRPAGEDVAAGTPVLSAGTRLRPAEIGMLAALGHESVLVHRRPRVAILSTGDELVAAGGKLGPGQIRDSNGPALAAMVRQAGGEPIRLGIARDAEDDLRAHLAGATAAGVDLIVTAGGVSVGDYDLVKEVLRADGRIDFWRVRIKPGKPLAFGHLGDRPLIGLPGNPVAAIVAFTQFVRPAILTMLGRADVSPPTISARLLSRIDNPGGRRHFVRVQIRQDPASGDYTARLAGPHGAGHISSLIASNGLLIIPEDRAVAETGERFQVQMPDWELG